LKTTVKGLNLHGVTTFTFFFLIQISQEVKKQAAAEIDALYDEIRPAIEEHERDSQDNVSTSLAEQWIEASCSKYKAEFDLSAAIIKNMASTPLRPKGDVIPREQNGLLYLQNGSS
jgi:hypothetical protein